MDIDSPTNSVDGGDTSADIATTDTGVDTSVDTLETTEAGDAETGTDEPQYDDDGLLIEDKPDVATADAIGSEEVEFEGVKYKVPAPLKDALLRQADYTKKTQELAEERKAIKAEREAVQQASAEEMSARANLTLIDQQIAQFHKVDWNAYNDQDPFEAQKAFQQFTLLKDARSQTANYISHVQQERTLKEQQETAKRLEEGAAELKRDIKDWSPATAAKLMDFAQTTYKFSQEDLDGIDDPRLIKVLHAAHQWEEHQAKAKKAAQIAKGQQVQPVSTLKGTTARTPVRADTSDFSAFEKYAASKLKA